jgi:hypothetical protein
MEDWSDLDFEQILNQEPLPIQKTYTPTEQASNLLPMGTKPIQLVQSKFVCIFMMLVTYVQHQNLKYVTLFFEQVALVAQTWF